jgi:hypothetical protein
MRYPVKYRVVTEYSSKEDSLRMECGRQILVETNNYQTARRECIEWAGWDDIHVEVLGPYGQVKFACRGAGEAELRYPRTLDRLTFG